MRAFKDFLRKRYPTTEEVRRRFGYPDLDCLEVNEWEVYNRPEDVGTIDDPVLQEWVLFRCESLARHNKDLADQPQQLPFRNESGKISFIVPPTRLYGMMVIS